MRVWTMYHHSYGEIHVLSEDSNVFNYGPISRELDALENGYEDERDDFIEDVERIKRFGRGRTGIEERFSLELVEVEEV